MFLLYDKSLPFGEVRWGDNSTDVHNIAPIAAESLAVNDADLLTLCFGRQACSEKRVPMLDKRTTALLQNIFNSILENNYKDIVVMPYAGNHTGNISNSVLRTKGNLLSPHAGQKTNAGIEITNITNITIISNQPQVIHPGPSFISPFQPYNAFDNMLYGIKITKSNVTIKNNRFSNMANSSPTCNPLTSIPPCPIDGIAVYVTDNSGTPIRTVQVGDFGANEGNTITNCSEGIRVDKNSNLIVFANTISLNTAGNFGHGIFVKNVTGGNIFISNDTITQYNQGINLNTINSSTVTIQNMNLSNPNNLSSVSTGIRISGMTGPGAATIQSNVISETRVGIEAVNARINSSSNNVTMPGSGLNGTGNYYGIRVSMGANSKVDHNTVTRGTNPNNQATTKLFGISVETSANTTIASNNTTKMGTGLQCFGNMSGSTVRCNKFTTCQRGITLSSANVGQQGSTGNSSDNQWITPAGGSGTDIFGIGAKFPYNWYVQNSTPFNPSFTLGYINPLIFTTSSGCN